MGRPGKLEWLTVGVVLAVAVAAGPLVGGIGAVTDRNPFGGADGRGGDAATGNVTFETVSVPQTATLDDGRYGSEAYYLRVPEGAAEIESVSGRPTVVYTVRIPDLGTTYKSVYVLSGEDERLRLTIGSAVYEPGEIERGGYRGRVTVEVRADGTERTVHRSEIPIDVRE